MGTSMHLWASRPEVSLVCMLYRREERPQHLYWPKRQWDAQWVAVESGPATLLPPLSHGSYDTAENICADSSAITALPVRSWEKQNCLEPRPLVCQRSRVVRQALLGRPSERRPQP